MQSQPNPSPTMPLPIFPNYMELRARARVSTRLWSWLRLGAVLAVLAYVVVLFVDPTDGLWLFWQISVPLLPALFGVDPVTWTPVDL